MALLYALCSAAGPRHKARRARSDCPSQKSVAHSKNGLRLGGVSWGGIIAANEGFRCTDARLKIGTNAQVTDEALLLSYKKKKTHVHGKRRMSARTSFRDASRGCVGGRRFPAKISIYILTYLFRIHALCHKKSWFHSLNTSLSRHVFLSPCFLLSFYFSRPFLPFSLSVCLFVCACLYLFPVLRISLSPSNMGSNSSRRSFLEAPPMDLCAAAAVTPAPSPPAPPPPPPPPNPPPNPPPKPPPPRAPKPPPPLLPNPPMQPKPPKEPAALIGDDPPPPSRISTSLAITSASWMSPTCIKITFIKVGRNI